MRRFWTLLALMFLTAATALAQDPVKVDPKHYKVEAENAQVRVLRIQYGPREKSVMHDHPAGVAVILSESHVKFTFPDGKSEVRDSKAGEIRWGLAEKHLPENLGDKSFEVILVELKGKPAPAKKAAPAKAPAKKAGQ